MAIRTSNFGLTKHSKVLKDPMDGKKERSVNIFMFDYHPLTLHVNFFKS